MGFIFVTGDWLFARLLKQGNRRLVRLQSAGIIAAYIYILFFFFLLFRAAPVAYGNSQARG